MTRSIFAILTSLIIGLGAQFAYAQPGRGMGMDPEAQIKELITQLEITSEQEPAFRAAMAQVNEMRMENMRGMRQGQGQGQGGGQGQGQRQGQGQGQQGQHGQAQGQQGQGANATGHDHAATNDQEPNTMRRGNGDGMEMMMQRRAEMEEKTQAILAPVLSAAQMEKYKEIEAARMAEMMSRMPR